MKGNKRKQMTGKVLKYEKCTPQYRRGFDGSRKTEWKKWLDFGVGVKVQGETLDELLNEGHIPIPTLDRY